MQYRKLGNTGIEISTISLGCWTMGGLSWIEGRPNGWPNVNEKEISEAVDYAIDQGVNHFDNADVYGDGRAERMLAKVLGKKNKNMIIATKVGWFTGTAAHAYEPAHIRHQCEQSLINLKRDYIDIYYLHNGNFGPNDEYLDGAIETMYRLQEEGKIRLIGQSAYSHQDFQKLIPKVKPAVLQSSANILNDQFLRPGSPTQQLMAEFNIPFIAFGPLAKGLLLQKFDKNNPPIFEEGDHRKASNRFTRENLERLDERLEQVKAAFGTTTDDLARVALQYVLHFKDAASVIPGFRNLKQVKINLSAQDKPLSEKEFELVKDIFKGFEFVNA